MPKDPQRLKKVRVHTVSVVDEGANQKPFHLVKMSETLCLIEKAISNLRAAAPDADPELKKSIDFIEARLVKSAEGVAEGSPDVAALAEQIGGKLTESNGALLTEIGGLRADLKTLVEALGGQNQAQAGQAANPDGNGGRPSENAEGGGQAAPAGEDELTADERAALEAIEDDAAATVIAEQTSVGSG